MSLLDLVLPMPCAGCGGAAGPVCEPCRGPLGESPRISWPRPCPPGLPPPWSVVAYADPARALLLGYKERGLGAVRGVLATALATAIRAAAGPDGQPVVVVPVPSSRRAVRARGDDVVLDLTRAAVRRGRRTGGQLRVVAALRHVRPVADSAGLTAQARAGNLAGAFAVRPSCTRWVAGARVVLADDLVTTGATLAEAARALRAVGADVVAAATVAATRRRPPSGGLGVRPDGATVG